MRADEQTAIQAADKAEAAAKLVCKPRIATKRFSFSTRWSTSAFRGPERVKVRPDLDLSPPW